MEINAPPKREHHFIRLKPFLRETLGIQDEGRIANISADRRNPWTEEDQPELAAWLKANEQALTTVIEATKRSRYFSPRLTHSEAKGAMRLTLVTLPILQYSREFSQSLTARALFRLGQGQVEDGLGDLLACHRLARLLAHGDLSENMVGLAVEGIAGSTELAFLTHADLPVRRVKDSLRELQEVPPIRGFSDTFAVHERFQVLDSILAANRHGPVFFKEVAYTIPGVEHEAMAILTKEATTLDPAFRSVNDWFDRMVATLRVEEFPERQRQFARLEDELARLKTEAADPSGLADLLRDAKKRDTEIGRRIAVLLVAVYPMVARGLDRNAQRGLQARQNVLIAIALDLHRREKGQYPRDLQSLAPAYLNSVPLDLFSGNPLIYRPSENGYLLYSVGPDGKDDGGGPDERGFTNDDIAIRMPLPKD